MMLLHQRLACSQVVMSFILHRVEIEILKWVPRSTQSRLGTRKRSQKMKAVGVLLYTLPIECLVFTNTGVSVMRIIIAEDLALVPHCSFFLTTEYTTRKV